ncbi:MAG: FecR family protein [Chitinophaga sp.]|uniref:FecR family protein n=1 Tax=Chitinophaga sp. TaxID=1869181 RepID=UPI001B1F43C3|nr:FecR family protein [Chitinophaga sp.]MBO9728560.1 FecR family protein [Chitinophaga sp.]
MEKQVDKALIKKFISNNCTPAEIAEIRKFLAQPGADHIFEDILNEQWERPELDIPVDEVQLQQWEHKFQQKIAQLTAQPPTKIKRFTYLKYAAVLVPLMVLLGYLLRNHTKPTTVAMLTSTTTTGKLLKIQLPDSTIVYLNASSSLQYPETFTGDTRTVALQGEAFFDVKQDEKHPFFVTTNKLQVQVLGTSFNVRSYPDDADIAVTVTTGKVGVKVPELRSAAATIVLPDQEFNYTKHTQLAKIAAVNAVDSKAWGEGAFIFNYETLENITKRLSRWYGVTFVCTNQTLLQKRFKLKLKNENLHNIMSALSTAGDGFKYEFKHTQIIIK